VRGTDLRPLRYAGFQVRANLMTIAPLLLIYTAYWALIEYVPSVADLQSSFHYLGFAVQIGLVIAISLFVPVVIRLVLPGGPLPEGRLRRRLETFTRDRGLRVSQILVWRTGSRMFATAFVIGLVSPFRYVFITDALLRRLSEDEILAVFAHEMGHVKHRHLWWLLAFLVSFALVMLGLTDGLQALIGTTDYQYIALALALAYGYFAFGYVSRRFERQADAFAAKHTSPELLAGVFLKLGQSNPAAMKKDGWRHFSLERRVRELVVVRHDPKVKRVFRAELVRGLALAFGAVGIAALLLIQPVRDDVVSGLATYSLVQLDRAHASSAGSSRIQTLRERTLDRAAAMSRLSDEYERHAQWYEGIVAGLSGEDTRVFDELLASTEAELGRTTDEQKRAELERDARVLRASKPSIQRAREHGTSFFDELDKELRDGR
jgi:Zn-dependent protease with chaperone function